MVSEPSTPPEPIVPLMGDATRSAPSNRTGAEMFVTRIPPDRASPTSTTPVKAPNGIGRAVGGGAATFSGALLPLGGAHSSAMSRSSAIRKVPVLSGLPRTRVPVTCTVVEPIPVLSERTVASASLPSTSNSRPRTGCARPCMVPSIPVPRIVQRTAGFAGGLSSNEARHSRFPERQVGVFGRSPFSRDAGARTTRTPFVAPPGASEPPA